MKGRLLDLSLGMNRKQRLTLELDHDFRKVFDDLQGKDLEISLKLHREKRSLDANSYFWVLAGKMAERLRATPLEIYRNYIKDVGGNSEIVSVAEQGAAKLRENWSSHGIGWITEELPSLEQGYATLILYYGSSTYDTAQMSRLIDLIVSDCKEQGIETLTPDKLDAMKERWGHAPRDKGHSNSAKSESTADFTRGYYENFLQA